MFRSRIAASRGKAIFVITAVITRTIAISTIVKPRRFLTSTASFGGGKAMGGQRRPACEKASPAPPCHSHQVVILQRRSKSVRGLGTIWLRKELQIGKKMRGWRLAVGAAGGGKRGGMRIKRLGIVGAGTMGGGIAALAASAGVPVLLLDVPGPAADRNAVARTGLDR